MDSFKINQFNPENIMDELCKGLFTEEFTLKNLADKNVTARHLQYWFDNGLLPNKKRKTDENHKFNFVDLIWIKIVYELRVLSFPINKIKIVKDTLLKKKPLPELFGLKNNEEIVDFFYSVYQKTIKDKEKFLKLFSSKENLNGIKSTYLSVLGFYILVFIKGRENSKFIIFNQGETYPFIEKYIKDNTKFMELFEKETYITIPLFKLMSDFIEDDRNYDFISKSLILNDNELKILILLRNEKFDSMTIHFKNGTPFLVEPKKNIKLSKEIRLEDIILKRGYEKIEIITQDGNITYSPKTTKIFL